MPAVLAYLDGPDSARVAPAEVARLTGLSDVEVLFGWTPEDRPWLADEHLRGTAFIAGYRLAPAIRDGRLRYAPIRLSAMPRFVVQHPPAVAVVSAIRRGSGYAYLGSVGWGPAAVRAASMVVVEVDEHAEDLGAPPIEGNVVAEVARESRPAVPPARSCDDIDFVIGRRVVDLLPDDPTIQLGPGAIAEAIVTSLERPVRIFSGLLTDTMAELASRDLLNGIATAGYLWGGEPIARLARARRLRLEPVEITHDISAVAALPRFVGCNTALQVGLDGAVNVERVGRRIIAGIGGHADYCAAGAHCRDGLSVIALRSTDRAGTSTIVPQVDVVSTPRCDVDVVVTEHGVADLRGVDDDERAERLAAIAAPQHRGALAAAGFSG